DGRGRRTELQPPLRLDQHAPVIEAGFFERHDARRLQADGLEEALSLWQDLDEVVSFHRLRALRAGEDERFPILRRNGHVIRPADVRLVFVEERLDALAGSLHGWLLSPPACRSTSPSRQPSWTQFAPV